MTELLNFNNPPANPFEPFEQWFAEAASFETKYPDAMSLATVDEDGLPDVRTVLLKNFDERGFVFYTNYQGTKGRQLLAHPRAALLLYWKSLDRQIRVRGDVGPVTAEEADEYFASRPRQSRIGAWASHQSQPLATREELEKRYFEFEARFASGDVPRPPHWSGFRLVPVEIEFWQEGAYRLHDRILYRREGGVWRHRRLNP